MCVFGLLVRSSVCCTILRPSRTIYSTFPHNTNIVFIPHYFVLVTINKCISYCIVSLLFYNLKSRKPAFQISRETAE